MAFRYFVAINKYKMATKVFISLPVKNLEKSKTFFKGLGYDFNPQFSDNETACMIISENIFAMLLTEPYFATFTKKPIGDAKKTTEVLIALDATSKTEVKQIIAKAETLGAIIYNEPTDEEWIYQHSFADLDGHQWEFAFVDESKLPNK
jgi:predicted lactoylglutathione lyase